MLSTFLELKNPLIYISKNTSSLEYKKLFLNPLEWAEIEELKGIFSVFYKPTIKLQGQAYTTLPQGLLYIYIIFRSLDKLLISFNLRRAEVSFFLNNFFLFLFNLLKFTNY